MISPAPQVYCAIFSLAFQLEKEKKMMPTMLCSTPCERLGLALLYQGRSPSYQWVSAGLCLSDGSGNGNAADLYLPGISLSFSIKINARNIFQPLSRLRGVGVWRKGWKNTQQMRNFSCNFSCLQLLYIGLIRTWKAPQDCAVRFVSLAL